MVVLRSDRRGALCSLLKTVLSATFEDALAGTDLASRAASSACAIGAMDVVLSAVHAAVSEFAEDWNVAQLDRLVALPSELVSEIFQALDFRGRLTVSHVCRPWRSVALGDRGLWAEFSIKLVDADASDVDVKAGALSTLLARSFPMPFRLHCLDAVPDAVAKIVIANANRMEVLELRGFQTPAALRSLLATDAPLLKWFSYGTRSSSEPPVPVSHRCAASAARLECLNMFFQWQWPTGVVSNSLRTFKGWLPELADSTWRLVDFFPNLECMEVGGVSQDDIDRLVPLPHHLRSLELTPAFSRSRGGLDYTGILRECEACSLRLLDIRGTHTASSVAHAIELFFRLPKGDWALEIDSGRVALWSRPSQAPYRYQILVDRCWIVRLSRTLSSWGRIYRLRLSLYDLLDLWGVVSQGVILPVLSDLFVSACGSKRVRELENGVYIEAPALTSVSVSCSMWEMDRTPILAPILRAFRSPILESAVMFPIMSKPLCRSELSQLSGLVKRLIVHDCSGGPPSVYEVDGASV